MIEQATAAMKSVNRRQQRRGVIAATAGTVVEYYDLTVYGYLAVVMSPIFFPGDDPTASLLASLAVFASAYLMRPIGGIVIGRIGDRRGRKRALFTSIILMGVGTVLMAFLPTYEAAGILSPILLVTARLMQGFSAGGELGGAITYVYESVGPNRRGLGASFINLGTNAGFAIAAVAVGVVSLLTNDQQMSSWGWRVPFLLGVPLLLLSLWVRTKMPESEKFDQVERKDEIAEAPVSELIRTHPKQVLQVFGLGVAQSATGYMVLTYTAIYLVREGGYSRTAVSWMAALIIGLIACLMPVAGLLVDRFGSARVVLAGLIWSSLVAYPAMAMMSDHGLVVAGVAFFCFALGTPLIQTGNAPLFPSLFNPRVRLTGVALGFNLAMVAAGGTAAYISTWLIERTGNSLSPAYFVIVSCVVGLVALASTHGRSRSPGAHTGSADDSTAGA